MPIRSWCMVALALLPSVSCLAPSAQAQRYRPDAEGFPCAKYASLGVVPTDQGFSIQARPVETNAAEPRPVAIALGRTFRIDRALFDRDAPATLEATDAQRP